MKIKKPSISFRRKNDSVDDLGNNATALEGVEKSLPEAPFSGEKGGVQKKRSRSRTEAPILTGVDAFITMSTTLGTDDIQGMVKVSSVKASVPLKRGYYKRDASELSVYIDQADVDRYTKVRLAAHAYLKVGLWRSMRMKGRHLILLGGDIEDGSVNVEVLVFYMGELLEVKEHSLPHQESLDFDDILSSLLSSLDEAYPGCVIEQCANLPRWNRPAITGYHDESIFKSSRPVNLHPSSSALRAYAPAAVMLAVSAGFYSFTVFNGFVTYEKMTDEARMLEIQMSTLTSNRASIQIMEARESFKNREPGPELSYVEDLRAVASSVTAIEGAEIQSIRAPGLERDIAAYMEIRVPRDSSSSALVQARSVLDSLVNHTESFSMRLSRTQGVAARGEHVVFYIEVIHG